MTPECKVNISFRTTVVRGPCFGLLLLIPTDRVLEEEEGEQCALVCRQSVKDRQRQFRRGLNGEKCVQNGRSQKAESAMSWGTELWVCFNSLNDAFDQVFGFFAPCLDADKTATL